MIHRRHRHDPRNGEPVAIDDYTGFKVPLSALKKDWQGFLTVNPERRNPQDFVRGVRETIALPFARPEAPDRFMATNVLAEDGTPLITEDGQAILDAGEAVSL